MSALICVVAVRIFAAAESSAAGAEVREAEHGRLGNRVELEALDQKVRRGRETAPFAMAQASREVRNWQAGGPSPHINPINKVSTRPGPVGGWRDRQSRCVSELVATL